MIYRDPNLLKLARGEPCLLRIPGVCNFDTSTTVAAHSNWGEHGKGKSLKASDAYTVWACYACHTELDTGKGYPADMKRAWFDEAHQRQIVEWAKIAGNPCLRPRSRESAIAALRELGLL